MKGYLISIVEAAYDLGADNRTWLVQLLERAEPRLNHGFGVTVSTYAPGMRPDESLRDTRQMSGRISEAMLAWARDNPGVFQAMNTPGRARCLTASQCLGLTAAQSRAFAPFVDYLHPVGIRDFLGVLALDPSGHAIWFGAPLGDTGRPSRQEIAAWSRIAAHVSAGARLRRSIAHLPASDLTRGSDAVISSSGAIEHAEPCAQGQRARESLRHAALSIDRARSKARRKDSASLDLWTALVAGRWSLADGLHAWSLADVGLQTSRKRHEKAWSNVPLRRRTALFRDAALVHLP